MSRQDWMERELEKISTNVETIQGDVAEIKVTLASQNVSLEHHIRRTDMAEQNLQVLKDEFSPVRDSVKNLHFLGKLIGFLGLCAGAGASFLAILDFLK